MKNMRILILFFWTLFFAHSINAQRQAKPKKDKKVREKFVIPIEQLVGKEVQVTVGLMFGTNTALNDILETTSGNGLQLCLLYTSDAADD